METAEPFIQALKNLRRGGKRGRWVIHATKISVHNAEALSRATKHWVSGRKITPMTGALARKTSGHMKHILDVLPRTAVHLTEKQLKLAQVAVEQMAATTRHIDASAVMGTIHKSALAALTKMVTFADSVAARHKRATKVKWDGKPLDSANAQVSMTCLMAAVYTLHRYLLLSCLVPD